MGLIINNQQYSFGEWQNLPDSPEWIASIKNVLREWYENEHVSVSTSGSTGSPKTFIFSRQQIASSAEQTANFFKLNHQTTALLALPADKIGGKMMVFRALLGGWELHCTPPSGLIEITHPVDFAALTPHQTLRMLNETPEKAQNIKTLIIGGAAVASALAQKLKTTHMQAYETYGMTETISHVALRKVNPNEERSFTALDHVVIGIDHRSCLRITTNYTGTLQTNDIVELVDDSHFIWKGRADFVINSGGVKIHPEEIEKTLETYIHGTFYIGCKTDEIFGQIAVIVIEKAEKDSEMERQIKAAFHHLPPTSRPKEIIFTPRIATINGKIIREIWS